MALNITINKQPVAASFVAGSIIATAVASKGTAPYTYSLATGSDKFSINSSTGVITTIDAMDITNISSFSVTATDSATTPNTGTSRGVYPNIQAAIQNRFNKPNMIYKITKDISLNYGVLTIPAGCTLDFQGGRFYSGTIVLNSTLVLPQSCNIKTYIASTITGSYKEGQVIYDPTLTPKKMKMWNGTNWVNMNGTALI